VVNLDLATPDISFPGAIAYTNALIAKIEAEAIEPAEIKQAIATLVASQNGARGFFVAYLTSDSAIGDRSPQSVIEALATAPETVAELLAKNVAMSAAMSIAHERNDDEQMQKSSQRVCKRSIKLIQKLRLKAIATEIEALLHSLKTDEGEYVQFLKRWGYDAEQRQAIKTVLELI
jgi:hypothetical protein